MWTNSKSWTNAHDARELIKLKRTNALIYWFMLFVCMYVCVCLFVCLFFCEEDETKKIIISPCNRPYICILLKATWSHYIMGGKPYSR